MNNGERTVAQENYLRCQVVNALGTNVQRAATFFNLYEIGFRRGVLSTKVKHLIALALAVTEGDQTDISYQIKEALRAGVSRDEMIETVSVAMLLAPPPSAEIPN